MNKLAAIDPKDAFEYLENLELPATILEFKERSKLPTLPEYQPGVKQAMTVGSQLAEFEKSFPAELRPHATNSFLLAQLAADKWITEHASNSRTWYNAYTTVLSRTGWVIEGKDFAFRNVNTSSLQMHKELIPILVAALGPAAAASSLIIGVLKGLETMSKDQPWITLFEQESQRANANQFQISYGTVDENKIPRLKVSGFELNAGVAVTQLLFFKLSTANARLSQFSLDLSANTPIIEHVAPLVESKIKDFVGDFIMAI